jgi:hypothetical protein
MSEVDDHAKTPCFVQRRRALRRQPAGLAALACPGERVVEAMGEGKGTKARIKQLSDLGPDRRFIGVRPADSGAALNSKHGANNILAGTGGGYERGKIVDGGDSHKSRRALLAGPLDCLAQARRLIECPLTEAELGRGIAHLDHCDGCIRPVCHRG